MTHDEMIAVIQGHRDGRKLETRLRDSTSPWKRCDGPAWNFDTWEYRLAPEPVPPGDLTHEEAETEYRKGAVIQWAYARSSEWRATGGEKCGPFLPGLAYRLKPAPKMVPLGPEDVNPGDAVRRITALGSAGHWSLIVGIEERGVHCAGYAGAFLIEWLDLSAFYEISHDGGVTWQRCEKEATK